MVGQGKLANAIGPYIGYDHWNVVENGITNQGCKSLSVGKWPYLNYLILSNGSNHSDKNWLITFEGCK
jgi:hypothetical protein